MTDNNMFTRTLRRLLLLLLVSGMLPFSTGCGIIYRHRLESPAGTIWTNEDMATARVYQDDLAWMQAGLKDHLPKTSKDVEAVTILIGSDDLHSNRIVREQEVHTAGWYNRMLSMVQFKPISMAEIQFLSREGEAPHHGTLLHELTHHFTSSQPDLRSRWWLTEAFACYFETAYRAQDDRFVIPPLHVENYRTTRRKLRELGSERFSQLVDEVIHSSWLEFYRNDGEAPLRYAISWSILWALQNQMSGTLEHRLMQVAQLDDDEVSSRIQDVATSLGPSLSSHFRSSIAQEPFRRWSVEQWLSSDRIDGRLILIAIENELSGDGGEIWGWPCVAQTIFRWGSGLDRSNRLRWQRKIEQQLREGPLQVRLAICRVIRNYRRSGSLIAVLVELLEEEEGELRAAAAMALSRISNHPTIVNPAFWINAPAKERDREVTEWRLWLDSR